MNGSLFVESILRRFSYLLCSSLWYPFSELVTLSPGIGSTKNGKKDSPPVMEGRVFPLGSLNLKCWKA